MIQVKFPKFISKANFGNLICIYYINIVKSSNFNLIKLKLIKLIENGW